MTSTPFSLADLEATAVLVGSVVPPTPQHAWPLLASRTGAEVWVKHENHTPIGAFKVRGGLVYMDWLARSGLKPKGVITATRGNHGQSIARAGRRVGVLKPVATGVDADPGPGEDGAALLAAVDAGVAPERVVPMVFAAPLAPVVAARQEGRRFSAPFRGLSAERFRPAVDGG